RHDVRQPRKYLAPHQGGSASSACDQQPKAHSGVSRRARGRGIYPDVVYTSWFAIVAPPKTPPEIAGQLSSAIAEVLRMPHVDNGRQMMSARPGGQSPAETARLFAEERERWRKVIASTGIKAQ